MEYLSLMLRRFWCTVAFHQIRGWRDFIKIKPGWVLVHCNKCHCPYYWLKTVAPWWGVEKN